MKEISIVGIGGALRENSTSEKALRYCLELASAEGVRTSIFSADAIRLPHYEPGSDLSGSPVRPLIADLRGAAGVIISSPAYHGGMSGALKNVLDYIEEMAGDAPPYLDGRAVGCIVSAAGWQGGVATLAALRSVVHSLRGWPTPLGVVLNSREQLFDESGQWRSPEATNNLSAMTTQVVEFGRRWCQDPS